MAEQQESASNFKRMSLDKIMEAATSDLDGSNNRYVAFGINPQHTAPNSWGHQYCGSETQHYYIPEEAPHGYSSNGDSSYFPPQEINHIGIDKNNDFIRTIDVGKGNFINVVYGNASQIMAEQCHISNIAQYTSPNVIERDYDLFDDRRQVNMPPNIPRRNLNGTRLIENLVGNWMPNQSGTYSPFGGNCDVIPAQRINASVKDLEELPRSSVNAAQQKKPRAVAEVKPMRPSYSDVLTKSATMSTASPFTVQSIKPKVECLGKKVTNKNSKNKAKATMLRRQNSCGNDDHNSPKIEILSQQKVLEKSNANLARRWVSLDNLGSTESRDISGFDKASQPDGKKTSKLAKGVEKEETFSNEKLSNTNGKSSASIPKRSVQTSNNMNMTNTSSQTVPTEKVVEKSNQQQRQQGVNKVNKEEKKIAKEKNSKRFLYEKTQQIKKAQRNRKRENSGGDSPVKDLCKNLKKYVSHWMKIALKILFWLLHLVFDVVGMSANLLILLGKCGWYHAILYLKYIWVYVIVTCSKVRFLNAICKKLDTWLLNSRFEFWRKMKRKSKEKEENSSWVREGLETNIALPSTGEEAMKRLLACKGKDPYSILGVTPTCSDDDIKKYYKRQAFLVHPDKNNQPGAEEAFKILVHAFHIIGEPERRQVFDQTRLAEATWVVLRDLLSQLHRKMEEAANTIRCIKCGLRHKRIPTQRPCYAARFCAQCKIRHSAKEGDFWAESHLMGFLWHYYACMEGAVYDVTDWAACQAGNIKQLKANTHSVQYRIVLGQRQSSQSANSGKKRQQIGGNSSETDFEDFISNLQSNSKNGSISTPNQNSFGGGGGGGDCKRRKTKRKK